MTDITILIPNYNGSKWISQCIESAVSQEYLNYDILIIDDASIDNSLEIIESYQKKYPKIKLLKNETNLGVSSTRNKGVREATSEYIAFLDSDDTVSKKWLTKIMSKIHQDNLDICGCWLTTLKENTSLSITTYSVSEQYKNIMSELWFMGGSIGGLIVKRELCIQFPFNVALKLNEDIEFFKKLLVATNKVSNVQESLYFYRRHSSNTTSKAKKINQDSQKRISLIPKKYRHLGKMSITIGAPVNVRNVLVSLYLGLMTLTLKNYFLYFKLLIYYSLRRKINK